jgi:hypothetical protein
MKTYVYKETYGKYNDREFEILYNWKFSMSGNYTDKSGIESSFDCVLGIF